MLAGNGLTFLGIAAGVLFATDKAAYLYGYTLNGVDGLNEFRAVYIGFWIGLTVLFFIAARKIEFTLLGDIGFRHGPAASAWAASELCDGRKAERTLYRGLLS